MRKLCRLLLHLADAALLLAMLLWPAAWICDPFSLRLGPLHLTVNWGWKPLLAPVIILALSGLLRQAAGNEPPLTRSLLNFLPVRKLLLALTATYLTVGMLEWGLKLVNFEVQLAPIVFETTTADGATDRAQGYADPELLWKFHKGQPYDGIIINNLGYRDREVDPVKPPGVMRVICMGDSVTAQGHPPYSRLLHDLLQQQPPTTNIWEAFNMAVYGYSSVQGLKVFQTQARQLQPDVVTLYFGWNDHWLEMRTDRNRMAVRTSRWYGALHNLLKEKRFFMLLAGGTSVGRSSAPPRSEPGFRVPPDEYAQVLTEFVQAIRAAGARPLLITAPRREVQLVKPKFLETAAKIDFNAVHDQYAEITRQVSRQTGADLLDLHQLGADPVFDKYFSGDGIHFRQAGLEQIADAIHAKLITRYAR
ncbi:MAG: SGNH/GDSL hydrolase family protein [Kiritimatiellia bacterium]